MPSSIDPTDDHVLLLNARRRDFAADKRKREECDSRAAESEARGAALRRLSQQGGLSSPKAPTNGFPSHHTPTSTTICRASALQRLVRESLVDAAVNNNEYATSVNDDNANGEPRTRHSTVSSSTERTVQLLAAARRGGAMGEEQEDERRLFASQASPPASGSRLAQLRRVAADLGIPCGGSDVEQPASRSATILQTQPRNPGGYSCGRVSCSSSSNATPQAATVIVTENATAEALQRLRQAASDSVITSQQGSDLPRSRLAALNAVKGTVNNASSHIQPEEAPDVRAPKEGGGASASPQARPAEISPQHQLPSLRRTSNPSPAQQKRSNSKGGKGKK